MASSPDSSPRHVGLVVDPLAREDGALEPDFQAADEVGAASALRGAPTRVMDEPNREVPPARTDSTSGELKEPGEAGVRRPRRSMRERLLDRARAHRRGEPNPTSNPSDFDQADPRNDLDRVGDAPQASLEPPAPRDPTLLSPTLIAAFGTMLGLITVASLAAVAMNLDSRHPLLASAPSAATVPAAVASAVPAPPPAPKRQRHKVPGPWRIADAKDDPALRVVQGTIGDKPFLRAVEDAGVQTKQAYRVLTALKNVCDLDHPGRTDRFSALVERGNGRLKAFELLQSGDDVIQAKEGTDGLLAAKKLDLMLRRERVEGAIILDSGDLMQAAERGGFEKGIDAALGRALEGHVDPSDLGPGTAIRVIVQEVTLLGEFERYAGVEAAEVRFVDPKTEPLRVYYMPDPRVRGYWDGHGKAPYEGGWRKPIDAPITSHFNPKRMHPILHRIMPHTGTDFGAPVGTPVGASAPGIVEFMGNGGPSGNLVTIKHPGGIETGYAHLSRYAEGLKVGDHVQRMQVVGYVGSTGRSTGPHLHFSAKRDGKFFDAETLNLDGMRVLDPGERAEFDRLKLDYDQRLDAIPLPPRPALPVTPAPISAPVPALESATPPTLAPAPSAAAPAASAAPHSGNPVYLTDDELGKVQSQSDGDEVP